MNVAGPAARATDMQDEIDNELALGKGKGLMV
jgi:hypothetical protein